MGWRRMMVRIGTVCFLLFPFVASASGCFSGTTAVRVGGDTAPDGEAVRTAEPPLELSWLAILYAQSPPRDTVLRKIEAATNTRLNILWVPDALKEGKLNMAFASGFPTKVVTVPDIRNPAFLKAVRSGWFWEIGPYLRDYPNLAAMKPTILKNTAIDGKTYGIYRERDLSRQGVIFRRDWLDNVGLALPQTIDDLYKVLKAFTELDPDRNGIHDTFGLADRNDLKFGAFKTLSSYFGTPNEWGWNDGKLLPEFMFDGYMETMKFMRTLYREKLINPDFALASKTRQWDYFAQGKAGVYIGNMDDARNLNAAAAKSDPAVRIDLVNRIAGPDGRHRVWSQAGHNGMFVFPKSNVTTEAELRRILAFFDRLA